MTERNTAAQASDQGQDQGRNGSLVSPKAIFVGALVAATTALLRPFVEASTESAVLVAVLLSVATTTSTAVFTAWVDKVKHASQNTRWKPLWRPLLFAGPLAGLAACLIGLSVVSGTELALGKEPSILPNGTPIIPLALVSYYFDADGDNLGSGNPVDYEQGSQPPRWVQKSGDKCPDTPGPPEYEGCPFPPPPPQPVLIFYYFDHDSDGVGAEPPPAQQHKQGSQPKGWVKQKGDECPLDPLKLKADLDTNLDGVPDAC